MKTSLRVLAATLVFATASIAQAQQGGGQDRMAQMRARMFEGITLTDVQKKSIDSISAVFQPKSAALRQEMQAAGGQPSPELRQKSMDLRNEEQKAIKALLTPEQVAQYDKNQEAMRANMRRGGSR